MTKEIQKRIIPFTVSSIESYSSDYLPKGVEVINAQSRWAESNHGHGVVVAVIDTGVDTNHPDLQGNLLIGKDFTGKGNYEDGNGHGTHVAGTIAATANGLGLVGVAPHTKILPIKALGDDGRGSGLWIRQALRYAIDEGVDVINMSLGGPADPQEHALIKEAVSKGIVVVAAAGNEGDGNEETVELAYPGYYPEVIQVGAVDFNGNLAQFSNTNNEVDILAPGVQILSTYPNGKYARLNGTSMATPHVAGAIALLKSKNVADYHNGDKILNILKKETIEVDPKEFIDIKFQEGPVLDVGVNGAQIEDVIDVIVERLKGFQAGANPCRENALAITNLEQAQLWLEKRTRNRKQQGVEGTYANHK